MSEPEKDPNLATAFSDVADQLVLLVREEIELAKAEISGKITKLIQGAVVMIAAGIFIVTGLMFVLNGAALSFYDFIFDYFSIGYFIVAGILFIVGGLAGWGAARAFKSGAPPTPDMAIAEAQRIKSTISETLGDIPDVIKGHSPTENAEPSASHTPPPAAQTPPTPPPEPPTPPTPPDSPPPPIPRPPSGGVS